MSVNSLVKKLGLVPHPEGGWYAEIWKGERSVNTENLVGSRDVGSTIYYLIDKPDFMSWHKLKIDEVHFWHAGGTFLVHTLTEAGEYNMLKLGDVLKKDGCQYQHVIPHDTWMAGELADDTDFVLTGMACFPGFDFCDWELGNEISLKTKFPNHKDLIDKFVRKSCKNQDLLL